MKKLEKNASEIKKTTPETIIKDNPKLISDTKMVSTGIVSQENSSKSSSKVVQKKVDPKEQALSSYKMKLQEEKKKKQEYKEHFKQMFEGADDVFLLPHHNTKNQEFIIAESKDHKKL